MKKNGVRKLVAVVVLVCVALSIAAGCNWDEVVVVAGGYGYPGYYGDVVEVGYSYYEEPCFWDCW